MRFPFLLSFGNRIMSYKGVLQGFTNPCPLGHLPTDDRDFQGFGLCDPWWITWPVQILDAVFLYELSYCGDNSGKRGTGRTFSPHQPLERLGENGELIHR